VPGRWLWEFVHRVEYDRDWDLEGKAYVYYLGSKYVFGSNSRTEDGEWFANRFIRSLAADSDPAQLGKLVRQAVARTRRGIPTRDRSRYAASSSRRSALFREAGVSWQWNLDSWADLISLSARETVISLVPSYNYRGYAHITGYQPLESQAVQVALTCSDAALGRALQTAWGLCNHV
jgi:hypothetical protein